MRLSGFKTTTTESDEQEIEIDGVRWTEPAGSIKLTRTTWTRQIEWQDYPRWALCRLGMIHRPHCHLYWGNPLTGYMWTWRADPTYDGGSTTKDDYRLRYWNPLDWLGWFRHDCWHCDRQDCLNFSDC